MTIGIIGLGRMGSQIARRLHSKGFRVLAWNRSAEPREELQKFFTAETPPSPPSSPPNSVERNKRRGGASATYETVESLIAALPLPKIIWLMLPSGELVDEFIRTVSKKLSAGDIIIDGGNSFYRDSQERAKKLAEKGIHFFDAGTSGGVHGEKNGFSLMVGGPKKVWPRVEPVFKALAAPSATPSPGEGRVAEGREGSHYGLVGPSGAGHFVKMVHNGIEYGMMEAIAEGFAVLKASPFQLHLSQIAQIWRKGSVVSSWLIDLAKNALDTENLNKVIGEIHSTGEGEWTIKEAKKLGIDARVIEDSFKVRQESADPKNQEKFSNKIVALLRKQFGGHDVTYKE